MSTGVVAAWLPSVKSTKNVTPLPSVALPAREKIGGVPLGWQTWLRSCRVIVSIATRPRWLASTRPLISPERRMVNSISENVASETISAIEIATSISGSVMPSSSRRRRISTSRIPS